MTLIKFTTQKVASADSSVESFRFQYISATQRLDIAIDNPQTLLSLEAQENKDQVGYRPEVIKWPDLGGAEGQTIEEAQTYRPTREPELVSLLSMLKGKGADVAALFEAEGEAEKLVIESRFHELLSLPWESLLMSRGKQLKVVRKIPGTEEVSRIENNNYLFLASHSYLDDDVRMENISEDFYKEVEAALNNLFQNSSGEFKPQLLTILRYLNTDSLDVIDVDQYANMHLMLHGRENGDVAFESTKSHVEIEWVKPEEVLNKLKGKKHDLIFLSCCYSGYGDRDRQSLAHQLVGAGVADKVIGFTDLVGSDKSIPWFVSTFYQSYKINKDVVDAFSSAVDELSLRRSKYAQTPILYIGEVI